MTQTTRGIRAMLSSSWAYSFYRWLVFDQSRQTAYVQQYVRPREEDRILDIGCGPADVLASLPLGVRYEGFDLSATYIEQARRRWKNRGTFHCARVDASNLAEPGAYDLVLSYGVLHHLDDHEAVALFQLAWHALKPGGRLVTTDSCYVQGQSRLASYLISKDRGRNVRDETGYLTLARQVFDDVTSHVRHDLLRIPYTLLVLECSKPPG
jgi:2-polyprenyl-3-methyl-5-hydroxy-6-metoxy-1,4-benzoquinol methylase